MNITEEQELSTKKYNDIETILDKNKEMLNLLIFAKRELELFYYGDECDILNRIHVFLKSEK